METQAKLLDKNYLATRIKEFKEIKRGDIRFEIYDSDRAFSNSVYITFFTYGGNKWYKQFTIRISDHYADSPHEQFIINTQLSLTKHIKEKFMKLVDKVIKHSHMRTFYKEVGKLATGGDNE